MKSENQYHTGIVVDDVDATLQWLTDVAGYKWCDKLIGEHDVETPEGNRTIPFHFAYSMSEPRLEIIATQPGTLWEPTDSGLHHLGFWSDDVEQDIVTLTATGMAVEVKGRDPFGTLLWAYCKGPSGPRIELVSRSLEPILSQLFANGSLDGIDRVGGNVETDT
jgi:hypothetical protein